MNYIRRAAGTVTGAASSAASYLPVVGRYFADAPAANNATRRNNRTALAPAPAPVAAVNVPAVNVAAPAPAPVAAAGGGSAGAAPEGTLARIRREKAERNAAAKAAANANKAAKLGAFLKPAEPQGRRFLNSDVYEPGHLGAAAAYTPAKSGAERAREMIAAANSNGRVKGQMAAAKAMLTGTRRRRATRKHRKARRS
jgi:hypothetical protein